MQQHQPVPQGHDRDLLQVVVLHGNLKHSTRSSGWIWLSFFFFKYIFYLHNFNAIYWKLKPNFFYLSFYLK